MLDLRRFSTILEDKMKKHILADKKGLSKTTWYEVFLHEMERLTGLSEADFDRRDTLVRHYGLTVSPSDAVNDEIVMWNLELIN